MRSPIAIIVSCGLLAGIHAAHADITVEERMTVEGTGAMALANMSGTTVTAISGHKARTETDLKMQSRLVKMFARDTGPTGEIVRLDQDKIYQLDLKKKEYTETSLAAQRAELERAMEQARQAQDQQPAATGLDEAECEWSPPKVEMKKTGAKAAIAGFEAEQTTLDASQTCTHRKTGAVCEIALSLDQWFAPDFDGGGQEALDFYRSYAEKMGFTPAGSRETLQRAEALFGRYEGIWAELAEKMRDMKGHPVRTSFALGFGGPQCQNAQEAEDLPPAPPPGSMGEAMATAAGQAAGEAAAAKAGESAFGGVAGQLGGKLAGAWFKKKKKEESQPEPAADSPAPVSGNGLITPLRVTSELIAVKKDPIPATTFDVPTGFKKVAGK